ADWSRLRDGGRVFDQLEPVRFAVGWFGLQDAGDAYLTSLTYDFDVLRTYLTERIAGDALVIFLGDHQPSAEITADSPSFVVPIHVVSRDHALVERFITSASNSASPGAGFVAGMWPRSGDEASRLPMEQVLAVLLR